MTAAKRLNFRENPIKRARTDGHRIGIIDDPCFGTVCPDSLRYYLIHRHCSQCAEQSSRSNRISYGLINPVCLGSVHIGAHLLESCGQYGNNDKVRTCQSFLERRCRHKIPLAFCSFTGKKTVSYDFIGFGRLSVNIVQTNRARKRFLQIEVAH